MVVSVLYLIPVVGLRGHSGRRTSWGGRDERTEVTISIDTKRNIKIVDIYGGICNTKSKRTKT